MKILAGYDGSKAAEDAIALAQKHAKVFNAELHIMTSLMQSPTLSIADIDKADSKLEKLKRSAEQENIACETHASVSYRSPGEDLVQFANDYEIDEIVIGIRRRSKVGKMVFGSTAQYVILKASCPVVSVK
jgi:nucleotide-binding universal stress UspA family protein